MADTDVLRYADGDNAIKAAGAFAVVNLAHFSRLRTFARHADLRGEDVMAVTRAPVKRAIPVGSRSRRPPCLHVQFSCDSVRLVRLVVFDSFAYRVFREGT
jgi:hypothetical protein